MPAFTSDVMRKTAYDTCSMHGACNARWVSGSFVILWLISILMHFCSSSPPSFIHAPQVATRSSACAQMHAQGCVRVWGLRFFSTHLITFTHPGPPVVIVHTASYLPNKCRPMCQKAYCFSRAAAILKLGYIHLNNHTLLCIENTEIDRNTVSTKN